MSEIMVREMCSKHTPLMLVLVEVSSNKMVRLRKNGDTCKNFLELLNYKILV